MIFGHKLYFEQGETRVTSYLLSTSRLRRCFRSRHFWIIVGIPKILISVVVIFTPKISITARSFSVSDELQISANHFVGRTRKFRGEINRKLRENITWAMDNFEDALACDENSSVWFILAIIFVLLFTLSLAVNIYLWIIRRNSIIKLREELQSQYRKQLRESQTNTFYGGTKLTSL